MSNRKVSKINRAIINEAFLFLAPSIIILMFIASAWLLYIENSVMRRKVLSNINQWEEKKTIKDLSSIINPKFWDDVNKKVEGMFNWLNYSISKWDTLGVNQLKDWGVLKLSKDFAQKSSIIENFSFNRTGVSPYYPVNYAFANYVTSTSLNLKPNSNEIIDIFRYRNFMNHLISMWKKHNLEEINNFKTKKNIKDHFPHCASLSKLFDFEIIKHKYFKEIPLNISNIFVASEHGTYALFPSSDDEKQFVVDHSKAYFPKTRIWYGDAFNLDKTNNSFGLTKMYKDYGMELTNVRTFWSKKKIDDTKYIICIDLMLYGDREKKELSLVDSIIEDMENQTWLQVLKQMQLPSLIIISLIILYLIILILPNNGITRFFYYLSKWLLYRNQKNKTILIFIPKFRLFDNKFSYKESEIDGQMSNSINTEKKKRIDFEILREIFKPALVPSLIIGLMFYLASYTFKYDLLLDYTYNIDIIITILATIISAIIYSYSYYKEKELSFSNTKNREIKSEETIEVGKNGITGFEKWGLKGLTTFSGTNRLQFLPNKVPFVEKEEDFPDFDIIHKHHNLIDGYEIKPFKLKMDSDYFGEFAKDEKDEEKRQNEVFKKLKKILLSHTFTLPSKLSEKDAKYEFTLNEEIKKELYSNKSFTNIKEINDFKEKYDLFREGRFKYTDDLNIVNEVYGGKTIKATCLKKYLQNIVSTRITREDKKKKLKQFLTVGKTIQRIFIFENKSDLSTFLKEDKSLFKEIFLEVLKENKHISFKFFFEDNLGNSQINHFDDFALIYENEGDAPNIVAFVVDSDESANKLVVNSDESANKSINGVLSWRTADLEFYNNYFQMLWSSPGLQNPKTLIKQSLKN